MDLFTFECSTVRRKSGIWKVYTVYSILDGDFGEEQVKHMHDVLLQMYSRRRSSWRLEGARSRDIGEKGPDWPCKSPTYENFGRLFL